MKVQERTIEKIRSLINEETQYRSGPQLVSFFNELGFNDEYDKGFPSRWMFTDAKLHILNDSSRIGESILKLLSPINFIGKSDELNKHIAELNEYLAYDGYFVERSNREIFIRERTAQDDDKSPTDKFEASETNHRIIAGGPITVGGDIIINSNKTIPSWNKADDQWYQKPAGQIIIGLIVTVGGGAILYFLFGV